MNKWEHILVLRHLQLDQAKVFYWLLKMTLIVKEMPNKKENQQKKQKEGKKKRKPKGKKVKINMQMHNKQIHKMFITYTAKIPTRLT